MTEHFPHQHSKGPHIRLGGEVVLKHRLWREPAQWDPCLSVVVVLTMHRHTGEMTGSLLARWKGIPEFIHWFYCNWCFQCVVVLIFSQTCCRRPCWGWAQTLWHASDYWSDSFELLGLCEQNDDWTDAPSHEPPGHRWKPKGENKGTVNSLYV